MLHKNYMAVYRHCWWREINFKCIFNIKQFVFALDLYYLKNKVKTGHPDSDKAQVTENITLKL